MPFFSFIFLKNMPKAITGAIHRPKWPIKSKPLTQRQGLVLTN